jgi:hypothetical protein
MPPKAAALTPEDIILQTLLGPLHVPAPYAELMAHTITHHLHDAGMLTSAPSLQDADGRWWERLDEPPVERP